MWVSVRRVVQGPGRGTRRAEVPKRNASWHISATAHQPAWLDQSELGQEGVGVSGTRSQRAWWASVKDGAVSLECHGKALRTSESLM